LKVELCSSSSSMFFLCSCAGRVGGRTQGRTREHDSSSQVLGPRTMRPMRDLAAWSPWDGRAFAAQVSGQQLPHAGHQASGPRRGLLTRARAKQQPKHTRVRPRAGWKHSSLSARALAHSSSRRDGTRPKDQHCARPKDQHRSVTRVAANFIYLRNVTFMIQ